MQLSIIILLICILFRLNAFGDDIKHSYDYIKWSISDTNGIYFGIYQFEDGFVKQYVSTYIRVPDDIDSKRLFCIDEFRGTIEIFDSATNAQIVYKKQCTRFKFFGGLIRSHGKYKLIAAPLRNIGKMYILHDKSSALAAIRKAMIKRGIKSARLRISPIIYTLDFVHRKRVGPDIVKYDDNTYVKPYALPPLEINYNIEPEKWRPNRSAN